jgi:integrase
MELSSFKNWLTINYSSQGTVDTIFENVEMYFRLNGELTQEKFNTFLAKKNNDWQASSWNLFLYCMKQYCKYAKLTLEFPKVKHSESKAKHYIDADELENIIITFPVLFPLTYKRNTCIFELLFLAGIRPKELFQLKREDVDFENKRITLRNTKTHRDRNVVLSDRLATLMKEVFQNEVENENAFNIGRNGLRKIFNMVNDNLNLKKRISPYTMRRSYAHHLEDNGADLSDIQKMLGHVNMMTTFIYLNKSDAKAEENIRKILNKKKRRK